LLRLVVKRRLSAFRLRLFSHRVVYVFLWIEKWTAPEFVAGDASDTDVEHEKIILTGCEMPKHE
jgi:hypothetical protein